MAAIIARPHRAAGRFAVYAAPDLVAQAPLILARAPARLGAVVGLSAPWPGGSGVGMASHRAVAALRQEIWRALRDAPGLCPVSAVACGDEGWRFMAAAAFVDRARPSSRTLDALSEIFHHAAVRRWGRWSADAALR
ncbi:hypothetical protein [Rubrimonas sp.]|uniref:hypothetical protein n=1 Tax=Rubrimonas sp. TaxID=2036015 RepID=UPI002FDD360F